MFMPFWEGSTEGAMEKEFMTVKEVAELLRLTPYTIRRMGKDGRLRSYSDGRRIYFKRKYISTLLRK